MKTNVKRLLCLALTLAMLLTVLPMAVLAATPAEIVDAAYALAEGEALPYTATLTGKIISVDTPYDSNYKNVTVTIEVTGREDKPIKCFRVKGEGADTLTVDDTITVTGTLKNYYGTIEFDAGCTLDEVVKGGGEVVVAPTDPVEIVKAAYALEKGAALPYMATLTGKIISVDSAYSEQYKNITVTIAVTGAEDMPIECYRLKGEGAETLVEGNIITVTGVLKRYYKAATEDKAEVDKVEFDTGCTLDAIKVEAEVPSDPVEIVKAAYALEKGAALPYKATLTGTITSVDTPYSEQYKNITVTIAVAGAEDMPIECYRMKGEGAENLVVGDTITVTGTLKRYYKEATEEKPELDKIEFDTGCILEAVGNVEPTTYYLFGYINGANYACEEDSANMGEYVFVDGSLTATFTADSYVAVKTQDNGAWFMTNGWLGNEVTSAVLYDTAKETIDANKLYVPANVEVTFTLTENADGTLILSYKLPVPDYTVSFQVPQGVAAVEDMICGENGITLPTAGVPAGDQGYIFAGWVEAQVEDTTAAPTIYTDTYTAKADTTLYALYTYTVGGSADGGWKLVTDAAALAGGDKVVIADKSQGKVASEITKQYLSAVDGSFSEDGTTLILPEGAVVLTLGENGSAWTLTNAAGQRLGATIVKKLAWDDGNTSWTIAIDETAAATIANSDDTYGRFLYNVNNPRFTTYTSATNTGMLLPQRYKLEGDAGTIYYTTGKAADPQSVNVTGILESAKSADETITVELWAEGAETAAYSVTTDIGTYTIEGVVPGTYTMKVSKASHVTRSYTVTVGTENEYLVCNAKICLIGDVTGDGRVNAGDVGKVFAHVKGSTPLTDEYAMECANANGGVLNIGDVATIYAHVKGSKMLF